VPVVLGVVAESDQRQLHRPRVADVICQLEQAERQPEVEWNS
jgi:hypothetical protein